MTVLVVVMVGFVLVTLFCLVLWFLVVLSVVFMFVVDVLLDGLKNLLMLNPCGTWIDGVVDCVVFCLFFGGDGSSGVFVGDFDCDLSISISSSLTVASSSDDSSIIWFLLRFLPEVVFGCFEGEMFSLSLLPVLFLVLFISADDSWYFGILVKYLVMLLRDDVVASSGLVRGVDNGSFVVFSDGVSVAGVSGVTFICCNTISSSSSLSSSILLSLLLVAFIVVVVVVFVALCNAGSGILVKSMYSPSVFFPFPIYLLFFSFDLSQLLFLFLHVLCRGIID